MIKIGFSGVPGSGKTCTARAVAAGCRLIPELDGVELVDEYARSYINTYGPPETVWEQMRIFKKQLSREDKVPQSVGLLITDSPVFLGLSYALLLERPGSRKDNMVVNDLWKEMHKLQLGRPRYDMIFHLAPRLEAKADGTRLTEQLDEGWRYEMNRRQMAIFELLNLHGHAAGLRHPGPDSGGTPGQPEQGDPDPQRRGHAGAPGAHLRRRRRGRL